MHYMKTLLFFLLFLVSKNFVHSSKNIWELFEYKNRKIKDSRKIKLPYVCPIGFLGSIMSKNLEDTPMQGSEVEWA